MNHSFASLHLVEPLQRALRDEGYSEPTPIQAEAIPLLLTGRDLLGCARTGTGKTAAFALPLLQRLNANKRAAPKKSARVLVIVPTRELAAQVGQSFTVYGRHLKPRVAVIYGGVGQGPQVRALEHGLDVLVATPGRLLDLMEQRHARLDGVEALVLDEADQMLDLGFLPDIKRVLAAVPARRQTLLFSATMPAPIEELSRRILRDPARVYVTPVASTVELVEQRVRFVTRDEKPAALGALLRDAAVARALVFTRTKRGCDRVAKRLAHDGIPAQAIHGDKSQGNRERSLAGFRAGKTRVLVATDIAARGIDIDDITHVVNYEIPNVPETYVHRIGRTARAGAAGVAISLCAPEEREFLRDIERLTKQKLEVTGPVPSEKAGDRAGYKTARNGAHGHVGPRTRAPQRHGGRTAAQPGRGSKHGAKHGGPRRSVQSHGASHGTRSHGRQALRIVAPAQEVVRKHATFGSGL